MINGLMNSKYENPMNFSHIHQKEDSDRKIY
jgi:hypothetical protein